MNVHQKQHFRLVDVANSADHGLIHHRLADRQVVALPETRNHVLGAGRTGEQIWSQSVEIVVPTLPRGSEQLEQLRREADYAHVRTIEGEGGPLRWFLPTLTGTVDVP